MLWGKGVMGNSTERGAGTLPRKEEVDLSLAG